MKRRNRQTESIVYGVQPVRLALQNRTADVLEVYLLDRQGHSKGKSKSTSKGEGHRFDDLLRDVTVQVTRIDADRMEQLTGTDKHQGIALRMYSLEPMDDDGAKEFVEGLEQPFILILDSIQDPRNFGACLRTAEASGVDLVVMPRSRSVEMTPVVSKVASGAAEIQPVARVSNLARFMDYLKDQGIWLTGTGDGADDSLYQADLTGSVGLVMGAEGAGMRELTRKKCDRVVSLPMLGSVESLNISVATGICLYEALRQRSKS